MINPDSLKKLLSERPRTALQLSAQYHKSESACARAALKAGATHKAVRLGKTRGRPAIMFAIGPKAIAAREALIKDAPPPKRDANGKVVNRSPAKRKAKVAAKPKGKTTKVNSHKRAKPSKPKSKSPLTKVAKVVKKAGHVILGALPPLPAAPKPEIGKVA